MRFKPSCLCLQLETTAALAGATQQNGEDGRKTVRQPPPNLPSLQAPLAPACVPLVCRRWHQLLHTPALLASVSVCLQHPSREQWLTGMRALCDWLVRHAAGRMRQLRLCLQPPAASDLQEHQELAALLAGTLAACGAAGGLQDLHLELPIIPCHLGAWVPASFQGLRRLHIVSDTVVVACSPLHSLTDLEVLHLDGPETHVEEHARLPPFITRLVLGSDDDLRDALPKQVWGMATPGALAAPGAEP